jgi:hypothetical protein
MDPMKALADLDTVVSRAPMDREGHAHFIRCVQAITAALEAKHDADLRTTMRAVIDTSERGPGA